MSVGVAHKGKHVTRSLKEELTLGYQQCTYFLNQFTTKEQENKAALSLK